MFPCTVFSHLPAQYGEIVAPPHSSIIQMLLRVQHKVLHRIHVAIGSRLLGRCLMAVMGPVGGSDTHTAKSTDNPQHAHKKQFFYRVHLIPPLIVRLDSTIPC